MTNENDKTFLEMTRERWSVRKFAPEQISDDHMARILEAGRNAPSACNYQPQRVLVMQSEEAIARVRSITHWAFNAPTVLLVCADLTESWKNVDGCDSAEVDATILADAGIITLGKVNDGVKVLGNGELTKKLTVKAKKFSASAKEKIEKAGGSALEV